MAYQKELAHIPGHRSKAKEHVFVEHIACPVRDDRGNGKME